MSRFYLHVCNGNGFTEDEEGSEYADIQAARAAAVAGLRDIMASELKRGELNLASFVEIEDEHHELVLTVDFTDAVAVTEQRGRRHG